MRFHTSLPVIDLAATEVFYRSVFETLPVKRKADYVKFLAPGLNLSFWQTNEDPKTFLHLGFEVETQEELEAIFRRLSDAGYVSQDRETSVCCYAKQDKFWITDPSGYRWEIYRRLADTEQRIDPQSACCAAARAT